MLKLKQLFKTIGELPTRERLNVLLLVLAVLALAGVARFLYNEDKVDQREKIINLEQQLKDRDTRCEEGRRRDSIGRERLQAKIDTMTVKYYELTLYMVNKKLETVNELKGQIKTQKRILK